MSIVSPARPLAARPPRLGPVSAWLAARRTRRLKRQTEREIAALPPRLLRDIGLVSLAHEREANGGRTLDHTRPPVCTALSTWTW